MGNQQPREIKFYFQGSTTRVFTRSSKWGETDNLEEIVYSLVKAKAVHRRTHID